MLEKIALPFLIPQRFRRPFFPFAHHCLKDRVARKGHQEVHMIRHDHGQMRIPHSVLISMLNRPKQRAGPISGIGKLD